MTIDWAIVLGGGVLTTPIIQELKALKVKSICFDMDPNCLGRYMADDFKIVSTKDIDHCISAAKEVASGRRLIGCMTCGADCEVAVAEIAWSLGLPGIPPFVAHLCNDKGDMRYHLAKTEFNVPYQVLPFDVDLSGDVVVNGCALPWGEGQRYVVKPVDECGSRGVSFFSESDLVDHKKKVFENALKYSERIIIEPFLEGSKHTIEFVTVDKTDYLGSVIDTHYLDGTACEIGLNTTELYGTEISALEEFALGVKQKIGIPEGPWKVDVVKISEGLARHPTDFALIELTARLSGGFHCQFATPAAYGTNEIRAVAAWACGKHVDSAWLEPSYKRAAAVRAFFPPIGRITGIELQDAWECRGVERIFCAKTEGDYCGPYFSSADRVGFVMVAGPDVDAAIAHADYAAKKVRVKTAPFCPLCTKPLRVKRDSRDEPEERYCPSCEVEGFHFPPVGPELFDHY